MSKTIYIFLIISILTGCTNTSPEDLIPSGDDTLRLKWNKAYETDTVENAAIGLEWAFSYLGARLPSGNNGIFMDSDIITVDISHLGFDASAAEKMRLLCDKIRISDEYQKNNAIDIGRFVTLILGATEHYYAITGVPDSIEDVLVNYILLPHAGYVNNSGVSLEHRKIQLSEQNGLNQIFVSSEVDPVTGEIFEFETVELMQNGQLRFGIFDASGNRKNSADPGHSNAGKPAKCMWCHESRIQQLFTEQQNFAGYLTSSEFQNALISYNQMLQQKQLSLSGGVDFTQQQQHTLTELLYISFMEPSAERLAREWSMEVSQVISMLSSLETHEHQEFPFLGTLYHRADVEAFAPFTGLEVSSSVREASATEVNHIP